MTVAVFGASGLVGTAAIDALLRKGKRVLALSRRLPELSEQGEVEHLSLDLVDAVAVSNALARRSDVDTVVYAAVHELPDLVRGWQARQQMDRNLEMFRNAIEPLAANGTLGQVILLQGTKAYGVHKHAIRVPSRECEPRDDHENFYWLQEDYIRAIGERTGLAWTIFRPPLIVGSTYGVAMNLVPVLGAYAAIRRAEGLEFTYPGGPSYVAEALDADLLADAIVWAIEAVSARNQHFNISNGEVFQWRDIWPGLAHEFGMSVGPEETFSISEYLLDRSALWDSIVADYSLRDLSLEQLLGYSHVYADFQFAARAKQPPPPALMSTIKLHEAGFHGVRNTEDSFRESVRELVTRGVLPAS